MIRVLIIITTKIILFMIMITIIIIIMILILIIMCMVILIARGKVMSQGANKLQMPYLTFSIFSSGPISGESINSCENPINSCRH